MKKYNLSKIMKRAWEIKKENKKNFFVICLKIAWEEAKMEQKQLIDVSKLPDLLGTEKQIAWATNIRNKFSEEALRYLKEEQEYIKKKEGTIQKIRIRNYNKVLEVCNTFLLENKNSKWWIEKARFNILHSIVSYAQYGHNDKKLTAQEIIEKYGK